jgi:YgiT-type zinc finger domain-containing protein
MKDFCPYCKGRMEEGRTIFAVDFEFGVVVVREVPAIVCRLCGADWIMDEIAEKLEQIVDSAKRNHRMVEIATWYNQPDMKSGREAVGISA